MSEPCKQWIFVTSYFPMFFKCSAITCITLCFQNNREIRKQKYYCPPSEFSLLPLPDLIPVQRGGGGHLSPSTANLIIGADFSRILY